MPALELTKWKTMHGDIVILVIGQSGAGKSTFINKAVGRDVALVGHGLDSCTTEIEAFPMDYPGEDDRRVIFVDTPGFDDAIKSDVEILTLIKDWQSSLGHKVAGIIYLHEIIQARTASAKTLLDNFSSPGSHQKMVFATTKWNMVPDGICKQREAELCAHSENFTIPRFTGTQQSAWNIVDLVLANSSLAAVPLPDVLLNLSIDLRAESVSETTTTSSLLDAISIPDAVLDISFEAPSESLQDNSPSDSSADLSGTLRDSETENFPEIMDSTSVINDSRRSPTVTALQQAKNNAFVPGLQNAASVALFIIQSIGSTPSPHHTLVVVAENAGRVVIAISEHALAGHMTGQIPYAMKTISRELKRLHALVKRLQSRHKLQPENFVLEADEEKVAIRCNKRIQSACLDFEVKLAFVASRLERVENDNETMTTTESESAPWIPCSTEYPYQ